MDMAKDVSQSAKDIKNSGLYLDQKFFANDWSMSEYRLYVIIPEHSVKRTQTNKIRDPFTRLWHDN